MQYHISRMSQKKSEFLAFFLFLKKEQQRPHNFTHICNRACGKMSGFSVSVWEFIYFYRWRAKQCVWPYFEEVMLIDELLFSNCILFVSYLLNICRVNISILNVSWSYAVCVFVFVFCEPANIRYDKKYLSSHCFSKDQ